MVHLKKKNCIKPTVYLDEGPHLQGWFKRFIGEQSQLFLNKLQASNSEYNEYKTLIK